MSSYYKQNYYSKGEEINLSERNFKLAFTIEDVYEPFRQKSDPQYVKWLVMMTGKKDGKFFERMLPYHLCTKDDYN